jgi:hypothetical protein
MIFFQRQRPMTLRPLLQNPTHPTLGESPDLLNLVIGINLDDRKPPVSQR